MRKYQFAVCLCNCDYEASLELRKLYEVLADVDAKQYGQLRIVDESGEDNFYPATSFNLVALPQSVAKRMFRTYV